MYFFVACVFIDNVFVVVVLAADAAVVVCDLFVFVFIANVLFLRQRGRCYLYFWGCFCVYC